jgi:eukaryotic-like serine/threonine-protein kinase
MEERVLAGRYRLVSKLGEGGMGSVWRAEHMMLHTQVAIKLIDPSIADSREATSRFQREAQAAAELRSTHIVQILDYGIDDSTPFIAMELLEGESLAVRLARLRKLTPSNTAQTLSQVARALARAHQRGIVHRDLKPDNIFIVREDADEIVKVLDFGIAKKLDGLSLSSGIKTRTGNLLGTPYYMSPEQALGQTDIDHRVDIWSLGIIGFECITGAKPFQSDTLGALLMAICHEPTPKPSQLGSVPPGFDEWFARAAARDRTARYQTAAEAAAELRIIDRVVAERPFADVQSTQVVPVIVPNAEPVAPEPSTSALLETASPASVTIPGLSRKNRRRFLNFLVVPAFFLLVALGYAFWRWSQLQVPAVAASSAPRAPTEPAVAVSVTPSASSAANPIVPVATPSAENTKTNIAAGQSAPDSARKQNSQLARPATSAGTKTPVRSGAEPNVYKDMN